MKRLTILTKPAGYCMEKGKYDGHVAVTRSLVEGLQKIGFSDFNYGANEEKDVAEQVHVLCNVPALKYAIELKKKGRIKILTAGPNIVPFPFEEEAIVTNPMIDKYLVPSEWIKRVYVQMAPSFEEEKNIFSWPAGVDTDFFCPESGVDRDNTVIVYHKSESDQFCYKISYLLRKYGFSPIVFEYGGNSSEFYAKMGWSSKERRRYSHDDFRQALNKACFGVVISNVETQGIALAEMWAMDVPTICYDPHYYRWEKVGGQIVECADDISSCPYLSEKTGMRFSDFKEFETILSVLKEERKVFAPRNWALTHMSDGVCAKKFLNIVGIEA